MLATSAEGVPTFPAFVARSLGYDHDQPAFLHIRDDGAQEWVDDPSSATPFATMREAVRLALRLPSKLRAFGILQRD